MHIHDMIDFTVVAYLVHKDSVLLIRHKELNKWLPVGGHVELDEDTDQALFREIREETGLTDSDVEVVDNRPFVTNPIGKFLLTPQYVHIHPISTIHRHIALIFFVQSKTDSVRLAAKEHTQIRWFSLDDLDKENIIPDVRCIAEQAINYWCSK